APAGSPSRQGACSRWDLRSGLALGRSDGAATEVIAVNANRGRRVRRGAGEVLNMATTCVWAFQPLPELNNQTGFVECEDTLAALLIQSGKAQDPRTGALALKDSTTAPPPTSKPEPRGPQEYDTKDMTAKPRTTPRK